MQVLPDEDIHLSYVYSRNDCQPASFFTLQNHHRRFGKRAFPPLFPLTVLAGIGGVALWPLHLGGVLPSYPGHSHARVMTFGLFGGFIFGFLGTAMPRMIGAMLLGMVTRISGDFWPAIMASHYNYGALLWIGGGVLWSIYVLPRVLIVDSGE